MVLQRLQVTLTGGTMGTGVATHYWDGSSTLQSAYKSFWTSVASIMSGGVSITVPNTGEQFDPATGALVGTWSAGTSSTFTGGGTGSYPGGVGACVTWQTSLIHNGRKVRGRTFIVPLALNQYDNDGSLAAGAVTTINTAASTLLTALGTAGMIWARPTSSLAGAGAPIVSGAVKDHVSWLRSRR